MSDDPGNTLANEELLERIAAANGIELFKKYSEADAAPLIGIHPQTLKQYRLAGRIQFLRIGSRSIAYFGFHIVEYLVGSMTWASQPNPPSGSATTGSGKGAVPRLVPLLVRCPVEIHTTRIAWHGRL